MNDTSNRKSDTIDVWAHISFQISVASTMIRKKEDMIQIEKK